MIIDGHFHVWPDAIARRALAQPDGGLVRHGDGTVASAIATMQQAGVDRVVALGVANRASQVDRANAFVGNLDRRHFVPFGTIHPDLTPEENLASLRRYDIRGVKLHPLFQRYRLDDPLLWGVLEALEGELPVLAHVGAGGQSTDGRTCTPAMIGRIARRFPRLDLIAAHFGGYLVLDEAEQEVIGQPVYVDTSWPPSVGAIGRERLLHLIERHGADRVVFATDWPMATPADDIEVIRGLGLSPSDTDAILGGTLARLVGLDA